MAEQDVVAGLWLNVLTKLQGDDRLSPQVLGYFKLVEPKGVLGDTVYLEVPNELTREILQTRARASILDAMVNNADFGGPTNFAVVVNPDIEPTFTSTSYSQEPPVYSQEPPSLSTLGQAPTSMPIGSPVSYAVPSTDTGVINTFDTRLNPTYTFDSFVIGDSNRMAHAAAFAVSETPGKAYNPMFIYGDSGLGKTHLLHAIGHYALSLFPRLKVRYVSSEEFTNDFINAIGNNRSAQFQETYREIDILLIDDIQFLQGKDQTQEAFFHTFNTLHNHNKQVVISSDLEPKKLTGFEERMLSRFEWGLKTDIQAPGLETRIAILRKKAERDRLTISDEILEYIAARVSSNIRELEGTLIRISAFAALQRKSIDMTLVQSILKDVEPVDENIVVTPVEIINSVAAYYKITPDDLYGSSRIAAVALARQIAMYICREQTSMSLPKIGQLFGGRDHTTVMYANRKIAENMQERHYVYNQVTEIISRVKEAAKNNR
jgi:chromosomal replication initiator protein